MIYDGESKQTSFDANGDGIPEATYEYGGDGNRVKKHQGADTTVFVYDAFGKLAAEYATTPDPNLTAGTFYRTLDHLGSTRLVTDQSGAVVTRHDFFPFGEEIPASATFGNRQLQIDGGSSTTYNQPPRHPPKVHRQGTGQRVQPRLFPRSVLLRPNGPLHER